MPATFKLKPGSRVDYRGKTCVILKTVTTDTVEVRIEDGNISRTVSAFELFPPDSKTARHDQLPALDHYSEDQLAEASKRYALIEPILESSAGRGELVRKQATAAGVSVKTIYRWIKKYRDYGRVSALVPGRKGRKMPSRLDPRVEKIIKSVVDNAYLTEQKPKISAIIERIRGLCKKRGLPLPHGNTIRNRIKKRG